MALFLVWFWYNYFPQSPQGEIRKPAPEVKNAECFGLVFKLLLILDKVPCSYYFSIMSISAGYNQYTIVYLQLTVVSVRWKTSVRRNGCFYECLVSLIFLDRNFTVFWNVKFLWHIFNTYFMYEISRMMVFVYRTGLSNYWNMVTVLLEQAVLKKVEIQWGEVSKLT